MSLNNGNKLTMAPHLHPKTSAKQSDNTIDKWHAMKNHFFLRLRLDCIFYCLFQHVCMRLLLGSLTLSNVADGSTGWLDVTSLNNGTNIKFTLHIAQINTRNIMRLPTIFKNGQMHEIFSISKVAQMASATSMGTSESASAL